MAIDSFASKGEVMVLTTSMTTNMIPLSGKNIEAKQRFRK